MILVIEDNATERTLVRKMLEADGHVVREAADGEAGLALFQESRPELVICDLMMPVKNGVDTIRDIRALAPDTRIVVVTGFLGFADHATMMQTLGVDAVLEKPFRQAYLQQVVRNVMALGK